MKNLKIKFSKLSTLALIATLFITSCSKDVNLNELPTTQNNESVSKSAMTSDNIRFASMEDLFKATVSPDGNQNISSESLELLADRIGSYITDNYDNSFVYNVADDYESLLLLGIAFIGSENGMVALAKQGGTSSASSKVSDCLLSALSGAIGISSIKSLIAEVSSGAVGAASLKATAKLMLKGAGWGITAGIAIYQLGDCMDWW